MGSVGAINAPKTSATGSASRSSQDDNPPTSNAEKMVPSTAKTSNGAQVSRSRCQRKSTAASKNNGGSSTEKSRCGLRCACGSTFDNPTASPAMTSAEAYGSRNRRASITTTAAISISQK